MTTIVLTPRKAANLFARLVRLDDRRLVHDWGETRRGHCTCCDAGRGRENQYGESGVRRFFAVRWQPLHPGSRSGAIVMSDPLCAICALELERKKCRESD